MVSTWLNVLDVVLDIQISRYRLIYPSTKDKVYEGLLSLVEFLPERNMERDCVEICSFSLSLSHVCTKFIRGEIIRKENKRKGKRKKKKSIAKMLVIPRLSDELRDASRFVARNFDHLNADQPVHLCLHSHNSSPVMESTNISIHSRLQQIRAHEALRS